MFGYNISGYRFRMSDRPAVGAPSKDELPAAGARSAKSPPAAVTFLAGILLPAAGGRRPRSPAAARAGMFLAAAIITAALLAAGCTRSGGGEGLRLGGEIPADQPVIKLADVLESPSEYHGRTVVMRGVVSGQCPSLCEFFFTDGIHSATIFPQGFKFPKLERGGSVTVHALVTSGQEQVVFSALGLRME